VGLSSKEGRHGREANLVVPVDLSQFGLSASVGGCGNREIGQSAPVEGKWKP